jgi:MFS family permease
LTFDGWVLFLTRFVRLFAYGFLSLVLVLYLAENGLSEGQIGLLLTLTLIGDTVISLWITSRADRVGRRRMLIVGASLMLLAGVLFALTRNFALLLAAATIGVISPSGNEVGPFLAIEQAALSQTIRPAERTRVFAWYNLAGSWATALGVLAGGGLAQALQDSGASPLISYRAVVVGYAVFGVLLVLKCLRLSAAIETQPLAEGAGSRTFGLHRSRRTVFQLSALFSLDAFAGGFVIQSLVAYWFYTRFGVEPGVLGAIFFGANVLSGFSSLVAAWIAARIGLINTMVFTHLPSNVLLILVPLMPTLTWAILLLLIRFSISQMDVPTRQSYTMAVVSPDERSAAAGVTNVARTVGASLAPVFTGFLIGNPALAGLPFIIAGGLKIVYDLTLYRMFHAYSSKEAP